MQIICVVNARTPGGVRVDGETHSTSVTGLHDKRSQFAHTRAFLFLAWDKHYAVILEVTKYDIGILLYFDDISNVQYVLSCKYWSYKLTICAGALLLTWINFNPDMDE